MKKINTLLAASVLAATAGVSAPVMADLSANIGFASEYYYRGLMQAESSASAGVDYESGSLSAGIWTADVGDGLEVDVYASYGIELGGLGVSVGYTTYQYTGEFDTEYNEVNLNLSYGIFSLEVSDGEHEVDGADDADYLFTALTVEQNGFYGTYGAFSNDWDGDYIELGYGAEIGGFETGVALIFSQDDLGVDGTNGDDDEAIIFTLGKSFDL